MHELSIALRILDIAAEESERRGGALVKSIHMNLGPLAGVVKDALVSAYEIAREQSPFLDSRLVIQEIPILVNCPTCQITRPARSIQDMRCSHCDTPVSEIVSGCEMEITGMEIEVSTETNPKCSLQAGVDI